MSAGYRPKVLLNASTIIKGGGVQAVVSFIHTLDAARQQDKIDWHLLVSSVVLLQMERLGLKLDPSKDSLLEASPSKNKASRRFIKDYVNAKNIDAVFTFFGPAYVNFSVPHICGVADGWVTHSDCEAYKKIPSWSQRVKMLLLCVYKGLWLRRADAWFVEQEAARQGLGSRLAIDKNAVHVIANNCAQHYLDYSGPALLEGDKTRILIFASYYPNKNIESVPSIAKALQAQGYDNVEFVLTIDSEDAGLQRVMAQAHQLSVGHCINNIGPVDVSDGPALYRSCQILLMPSVLETFSAVYPEAMAMGLPIVTTDKSFARAICADAASYYISDKPDDAAKAIATLLSDQQAYEQLAAKGTKRLEDYPNADKKYQLLHDMVVKYT